MILIVDRISCHQTKKIIVIKSFTFHLRTILGDEFRVDESLFLIDTQQILNNQSEERTFFSRYEDLSFTKEYGPAHEHPDRTWMPNRSLNNEQTKL